MVTITSDRRWPTRSGAADYLTKPIERDRLLSVLKRFDYDCRRVPCKVLVVDDDDGQPPGAANHAGARSWLVEEATERAGRRWSHVEKRAPDLILLDLMMPNMDGFEVAERLHRDGAWRQIPVVVVTAKDLTEDDRRRLNGSVLRVVRKGGGPETLVQALGDLTGRAGRRGGAGRAAGGLRGTGHDRRGPRRRPRPGHGPQGRAPRRAGAEKSKGRGRRASNGDS